ncbi:hypothetical protein HDU84_000980, partial [Entophlyctis sp. JEL0112]
ERRRVEAAIGAVVEEQSECRQRVAEMETRISSMRAEIEVMRPKFVEAHKELKSQMNLVEINAQLLASVGDEYKTLKTDLARDTEELDIAKAKVVQLANQVAVQSAINDRERTRLQQASQSLSEVRAASLTQLETLNSLEKEGAAAASAQQPISQPPPPPSALEKRRSKEPSAADTPSPVVSQPPAAIGIPPPPMPSRTTKPKMGSSVGTLGSMAETDALNAQPSSAAAVPGSDFAFDVDFDSAFSTTGAAANAATFDDAFSVPTAASAASDTKRTFDDLFPPFTATPNAQQGTADAFAVSEKPLAVSAFASPPPSVSQTASGEGFNKFKLALAGPGSVGAFADTNSARSGSGSGSHARRRMTKLMSVDLDSELENAFGSTGGTSSKTVNKDAPAVAAPGDVAQSVTAMTPVTGSLLETSGPRQASFVDEAGVPNVDGAANPVGAPGVASVETPAGAVSAGLTAFSGGDKPFLDLFGPSPPGPAFQGNDEVVTAANGEGASKSGAFSVATGTLRPHETLTPKPDVTVAAVVAEISETKMQAAAALEVALEVVEKKSEATVEAVSAKSEVKQDPVAVQVNQVDVAETVRVTAAQPDDLDEVKNLVGMGFTRDQSIEVLERNGFDTEKALNELLPQ